MIELPRLENGDQHVVCSRCGANVKREDKYYCDVSRVHHRPILCPVKDAPTGPDAYALLAQRLRQNK